MVEDQSSKDGPKLRKEDINPPIPTDEELAEVLADEVETNRRLTEEAQNRAKIPVTAEQLHAIFTSPEFQTRVLAYMNTRVPDPQDLKTAHVLAAIFNAQSPIRETPEKGFAVNRYYDMLDTVYSEEETGTGNKISIWNAAMILKPDLFKMMTIHHEPYHPSLLKRAYPMLSVTDKIGLSGDLTKLSESRRLYREEYGVDIRSIKAALQGGSGIGRLVIIQEAGQLHTAWELASLDAKIVKLASGHMTEEELIRTVTTSGYHMWVSPITKGELIVPNPNALKQFVFTPTNFSKPGL